MPGLSLIPGAGGGGGSGKSAYELAVDAGYVGSQEAWLSSLSNSIADDFQGRWSNIAQYAKGNIVSHANSLWLALEDNFGSLPNPDAALDESLSFFTPGAGPWTPPPRWNLTDWTTGAPAQATTNAEGRLVLPLNGFLWIDVGVGTDWTLSLQSTELPKGLTLAYVAEPIARNFITWNESGSSYNVDSKVNNASLSGINGGGTWGVSRKVGQILEMQKAGLALTLKVKSAEGVQEMARPLTLPASVGVLHKLGFWRGAAASSSPLASIAVQEPPTSINWVKLIEGTMEAPDLRIYSQGAVPSNVVPPYLMFNPSTTALTLVEA